MEHGRVGRLVMVVAVLALAGGGLVAVSACACSTGSAPLPATSWRAHLAAVDEALADRNASHAVRGWLDAHGAALRTGAWDALVEVGDASLRLGDLTFTRDDARARARALYLHALFRARAQGSVDGVLRVTEAFSNLGDAEVVEQGLRVARQLAATQGPEARDRVREATLRLGARQSMARGADAQL